MSFEDQIQSTQNRLHTVQKLANNSSPHTKALQHEAIAECSIILDELHIATEKLQTQNEELLANRQMLALERQRYKELFDFAPDGYLVTNAEGVIQQANCAATVLFNLNKNLVIGRSLILFVDEAGQASFQSQLEQLINSGHSLSNWEVSLKSREKPPCPVSISVSTIYYNPTGGLSGFRWILRDLSQRKQSEQNFREQTDLLNDATDGILVRSLENQILLWNQGAERLYGWTAAEALGKNTSDLLYQNCSPQTEALQNSLVIKDGEWRGELEQVTHSNQNITVESHWTLVRDEKGRPKSISIINTDITEKKRLQSDVFQCQRVESLGTLSCGIAHDLNNILTPILGIAQLLPLKFPTVDEQSLRLMTLLESTARRGIGLIQQIKLFAGGSKGEQTVLQPGALILEMEELAKNIFPKSIDLNIDIASDLWWVAGNSVQLYQVLMNLCINAQDAMPHGGELHLYAKNLVIDQNNIQIHPEAHLGPYVVITVADTGIGIPADILAQIFEPLFTTKGENKGSGLGLSIVAGIIKGHHGFVMVSSQVGQGTQFQVFLPAIPAKS
jgi:two-component system, cell cycle sensor histidine kinase and response regulator CckA